MSIIEEGRELVANLLVAKTAEDYEDCCGIDHRELTKARVALIEAHNKLERWFLKLENHVR